MMTTPANTTLLALAMSAMLFCFTPASAQSDPKPEPLWTLSPVEEIVEKDGYPSVETVADKFATLYGEQGNYFYDFEKRPEGYTVTLINPEDYPKVYRRALFWSKETKKWLDLPLKEHASSRRPKVRNKYYYDRVPYYGYRGWFRDVIQLLETKTNRTADEQFSLATAWYERAAALLSDQHAFADSLEVFVLPETKNALSPSQLDIYLSYMNKALEHYEVLAQQWPDYKTVVGPATVKLADQYMTAFMQLHYFQNEETALKVLDRPALTFNEYLLESSRNLLQSCPPNAILLTYGDNDTYPLWYVQAKQGFRRDVVVANLSLLAIGRYVNHLRDPIFDAAPLRFQLSPGYYFKDASTVVYLKSAPAAVRITDFFGCLDTDGSEYQFGYPVCQGDSIYFITDNQGNILPNAMSAPKGGRKVSIPLNPKAYLIRDQVAVLDMLYMNSPQRPLCFAATCTADYLIPYKDYLRLEGWVYRFSHQPIEITEELHYGTLDEERSYELFMNEMKFDSKGAITEDGIPYFALNRKQIGQTALALANKGQKEKAVKLLDRYFQAFPDERMPFEPVCQDMVQAYETAGKLDAAARIAQKAIQNVESGRVQWYPEDEYAIAYFRSLIQKGGGKASSKH